MNSSSISTSASKAIVAQYIDELNRRDTGAIDRLVAADFRATVWQGYSRNVTAFPDYIVQVEEMIAEDDRVVVVWRYRGTHRGNYDGLPPTGKVVSGRAISIYWIVEGQITRAEGIWDQASFWQQLGLIPDTSAILNPSKG